MLFSNARDSGLVPPLALMAVSLLGSLAVPAHAVSIEWVMVGDPGNAADTSGYGAVADSFQIMKFEFTNQQYTAFLNSVDPTGTNPHSVYSANMGINPRAGIAFNSGAPLGSKYDVKTSMGDKAVNYVSWFNVARVSNWLENGATSSSDTETGAYTLNGATSGTAPAANPGATFYIPSEDQWYKAAYYKGGSTNAGYWTYATQSNAAPTAVNATDVGTGTSGGVSPVTSGNFANYNNAATWNGIPGNVTTVGANGGPSAYGAFDMSGNLKEWIDAAVVGVPSLGVQRGGYWADNASRLSSSGRAVSLPMDGDSETGFRLVPEPSTCTSLLAGLAVGGWHAFRHRRARPT